MIGLQASKWIQIQVLLDTCELKSLFDDFGDIKIFPLGVICDKNHLELPRKSFFDLYNHTINDLKSGNLPEKELPTVALTRSAECLHFKTIDKSRCIPVVVKPIIQVQPHRMHYSPFDGKFRPMVLGKDTIPWGVQFSYPQLCQINGSSEPLKVDHSFENSALFRQLQKWIRRNTLPTPILLGGKTIKIPIRIGRECFHWVNQHPQLKKLGLQCQV